MMTDEELFNLTWKPSKSTPVRHFANVVEKNKQPDEIDISRRFGVFLITDILVRQQPKAVMKVMSQCIILRCEYLWDLAAFEYKAISPGFSVVPEGCLIPRYQWIIDENGNVSSKPVS